MQVQIRDDIDSPWRDIDWLDPRSVDSTNKMFYAFEKFRIAPEEEMEDE